MNYNQNNLTDSEIRLIEKIINYSLVLDPRHTVCFNEIVDKVQLDLSVPNKYDIEHLDINKLKEQKEILDAKLEKARKDYFSFRDERRSLPKEMTAEEYEKMAEEAGRRESHLGDLANAVSSINSIIERGGIVKTPLLGSFSGLESKVYLYLGNIESHVFIRNVEYRKKDLIQTFIHEMFHAWNYYKSGEVGCSVKVIDEPMVEFGTLLFLKAISNYDSDFEPIYENAMREIGAKRKSVGELAAYGFGYYINTLIGTNEEQEAKELLGIYSERSGNIVESSYVSQVKNALCPAFPFDDEHRIYELFKLIIRNEVTKDAGGWKNCLLECINSIPTDEFTLSDIYQFENELRSKYPTNNNIRAKIRQQLAKLRDMGVVKVVGKGKYRKNS